MPFAVAITLAVLLPGAAFGLRRHLRRSAKAIATGAGASLLLAASGAAIATGVLILAVAIVVDTTWFSGAWGHVGYIGSGVIAALAVPAELLAVVTYVRRDRPDSVTLRCGLAAFVVAVGAALLAVGVTNGT